VNRWGRSPKEPLQVRLCWRPAVHHHVVVDKGQVLTLFFSKLGPFLDIYPFGENAALTGRQASFPADPVQRLVMQ